MERSPDRSIVEPEVVDDGARRSLTVKVAFEMGQETSDLRNQGNLFAGFVHRRPARLSVRNKDPRCRRGLQGRRTGAGQDLGSDATCGSEEQNMLILLNGPD